VDAESGKVIAHANTPILAFAGEAHTMRHADNRLPNTLHRIDSAIVIAELEGVGFVLDGESNVLANPEDDHTKGVFDPEIRGKTDRYVLRFRKPE